MSLLLNWEQRTSVTIGFLLLMWQPSLAQPATSKLQFSGNPPAELLSSRSVVLYDPVYGQKELEEIQKSFKQTGIDPIAYFERDVVQSGNDVMKAFSEYFNTRQIKYLVILEKYDATFRLIVTAYDQTVNLFAPGQPAWLVSAERLSDLLRTAWQDSWRSQKKQNYLINEFPERDIVVDPFTGNRQEFYAIDLKVDNLAVPRFGNEAMDKELEQFFKDNYPLKYKIVDAGTDEKLLRSQGFLYTLCFVHTRGVAAKEILGYDMSKSENAYAVITFPNGQLQLKILPKETIVYKFYFRHIDNGNVFMGTKWDADVLWLDALRNHILGFKLEAKIN